MKALMSLQEEQEEYILKTQREKQELKQEMEAKSRALEEAQRQLEEVRANRHRVDQDVVVRGALSVHLGQTGLVGFMRKQVCKKTTGSSLCRFGMRHSTDVAGSSLGFLSRFTSALCLRQAAQRKLRQASTNVKHWNVQMNRLMRPIGPGGASLI